MPCEFISNQNLVCYNFVLTHSIFVVQIQFIKKHICILRPRATSNDNNILVDTQSHTHHFDHINQPQLNKITFSGFVWDNGGADIYWN